MRKWIHRIIDFLYDSIDQHIGAFAGQSTFFIFLSIFPLVSILLSLTPYLPFTEEQITDLLVRVMPPDLAGYARDLISDIYSNGVPTMTFFSAVIGLWSAAKGIMAIRNGLNEIYHSREKRNYLVIRGISAIYTLIFIFIFVLLTLGNLFGRQIYTSIVEKYGADAPGLFDLIIRLRGVGSFIVIFIMLWLMYTLMPSRKLQFRYQAPGAVFTAGAWALVTWLFSYFIEYAMNRSAMYGSLTTIITILFWLYVMVNMIFIGAQLNEFLYLYVYKERVEQRAERKRKIKAMRKAKRVEKSRRHHRGPELTEKEILEGEGVVSELEQEDLDRTMEKTGEPAEISREDAAQPADENGEDTARPAEMNGEDTVTTSASDES